jgi:hypothetical protein
MAEREQLALNSLVSPAGILPGPALDQRGHRVRDGWTTDTVRICPLFFSPSPTLAEATRAVVALGSLQDCTIQFPHVPEAVSTYNPTTLFCRATPGAHGAGNPCSRQCRI